MADSASVPLWVPVFTAALAFVGTAAGYISAQLVEINRGKREREARKEARRIALFDRRTQFQRDTLMECQQLAERWMFNFTNVVAFQKLSEELSSTDVISRQLSYIRKHNKLTFSFGVIWSRIRDEETFQVAQRFAAMLVLYRSETTAEAAEKIITAAGVEFAALLKRIGIVLRELDDTEIASES